MLSSSSDGVKEANNVGVRRVKLMPWSEWLESEEEEVTNDVLVVVVQPGNIGEVRSESVYIGC